jgi:predicted transposase YbfD/YdcC
LPLLRQLDLTHVLVTGDALFAQRSLCAYIVEHGGQYLFEVKDNQAALVQALQRSFRDHPVRARRQDARC